VLSALWNKVHRTKAAIPAQSIGRALQGLLTHRTSVGAKIVQCLKEKVELLESAKSELNSHAVFLLVQGLSMHDVVLPEWLDKSYKRHQARFEAAPPDQEIVQFATRMVDPAFKMHSPWVLDGIEMDVYFPAQKINIELETPRTRISEDLFVQRRDQYLLDKHEVQVLRVQPTVQQLCEVLKKEGLMKRPKKVLSSAEEDLMAPPQKPPKAPEAPPHKEEAPPLPPEDPPLPPEPAPPLPDIAPPPNTAATSTPQAVGSNGPAPGTWQYQQQQYEAQQAQIKQAQEAQQAQLQQAQQAQYQHYAAQQAQYQQAQLQAQQQAQQQQQQQAQLSQQDYATQQKQYQETQQQHQAQQQQHYYQQQQQQQQLEQQQAQQSAVPQAAGGQAAQSPQQQAMQSLYATQQQYLMQQQYAAQAQQMQQMQRQQLQLRLQQQQQQYQQQYQQQ